MNGPIITSQMKHITHLITIYVVTMIVHFSMDIHVIRLLLLAIVIIPLISTNVYVIHITICCCETYMTAV